MAAALSVPDILDRIISAKRVTDSQLDEAAQAAAGLRRSFFQEFFAGIEQLTPHTDEFDAFKRCLKGMVDILMKNGIIGVQDAQLIWLRVEELEG